MGPGIVVGAVRRRAISGPGRDGQPRSAATSRQTAS